MKKMKILFLLVAIVMSFAVVSMTASAASSVTCSHTWVMANSEGTSCSGYTYVYACTKCYATKTEETAATQPHKWTETYKENASCTKDGVVMVCCTVCLELKQETTKALGHSYTYASNNDATCTKDGTLLRVCQRCSETDIVPDAGSAKGHSFAGEWQVVVPSDCLEKGVSKRLCKECGAGEFRYDDLAPHKDKNKDNKCDVCSETLSIFTPTVPDDDAEGDCSCKCHKGGIAGFFWKIGNFFAKLFRIKSKQICACGAYHF